MGQKKANNKSSKPKKRTTKTKTNNNNNNGGAGNELKKEEKLASSSSSSWPVVGLLAPLVLLVILVLLNYENIVPTSTTSTSTNRRRRKLTVGKKFLSRQSQVYVIPNFLPNETAIAWRQKMQQLWNQTLDHRQQQQKEQQESVDDTTTAATTTTDTDPAASEACGSNADGEETCGGSSNNATTASNDKDYFDGFTFATNNDGRMMMLRINNAKVRSLDKVDERRLVARAMSDHNLFAYSKWELEPTHPLLKEIEYTLTDPVLLQEVQEILQQDYPTAQLETTREMSDIFVTHYAYDDFLSPHNDGASGSWAVVVNLVDNHDFDGTQHGGGLQFQCPGVEDYLQTPIEYCETLYPTFNTAVIFATHFVDPTTGRQWRGPTHQVLKVERPQGGRYAITGWWMDKTDFVSESYKAEREKMRARGK